MPSNFSSCSIDPAGSVLADVNIIGTGRGLPEEMRVTVGLPEISVTGGLFGSDVGLNSATVPLTKTELPTEAAEGGAVEVKTNMPSDVFGSASISASGVCMK